jgi:hypothetical protein
LTSSGFAGPLNGTVGATTANTGAFTTVSASGVATFSAGTVSLPAITTSGDTNTGIYFPAADTIAFTEGGAEAMRIDADGDVGIGTSSPAYKLDINRGSSGVVARFTGGGAAAFIYADSSQVYYGASSGVPNCLLINDGSNYLTLNTNSSERMRIDSAGRLGVGLTPTANNYLIQSNSGVRAGTAVVAQGTLQGYTGAGIFLSYESTYGRLESYDYGASAWKDVAIAPNGGNVGIGTNSPTKKLDVYSTTQRGQIAMSGSNVVAIRWNTTDPNAGERNWEIVNNVDAQGTLSFRVGASQTADPTTTRMVINSSGNVGIGTSSPTKKLEVANSDALIYGLTVGRGAGAVSTNTAVGASALNANTSGARNTAIGYNSLLANQTGGLNTAVGEGSLKNNTANDNTAVGVNSLLSNTSGTGNTAVGRSSASVNTTGSALVAIGYGALDANTTGSNNVAVGLTALQSNTTASNNTAVGYQAGYSNTTGTTNAFFGYQAGYNNIAGIGNTFIGMQAGSSHNTAGNTFNTFVGYYSGYSTTGTLNTFLGEESGYSMTTGSKNTIVGRYNGNQGGLDIRTSSNYIVLSDGDGNIGFTTVKAGGTQYSWALPGASNYQGTGITFPATQNASSDANTLDDYEEGTWTPSVGGNTTYTTQVGIYTKVGRVVTCEFEIHINTIGTGSTTAISGLPFTSNSQSNGKGGSVGYFETIAPGLYFLNIRLDTSSTTLGLGCTLASTTALNTVTAILQNGTRIRGSITYNAV